MATHSSVLAWRIPGTGKPGGLPSLGSHRVGHDWSDLAAAAAAAIKHLYFTNEQRSARKYLSGTSMFEKSLAVFWKVKHTPTVWSIPLLKIYTGEKKTYAHTKNCTWMFIVSQYATAKNWKPKGPSTNEWINKSNLNRCSSNNRLLLGSNKG